MDKFYKLFTVTAKTDSKQDMQLLFPILADLQDIDWLTIGSNGATATLKKNLRWSQIAHSPELKEKGYTLDQEQWIKDMLFEQFKVANVTNLNGVKVDFVGDGFYVDRINFAEYKGALGPQYNKFKA